MLLVSKSSHFTMTITVDIRSPIIRIREPPKLYYTMSFRWTDHFYCPLLQLFFNYNVFVHKQPIEGLNLKFPCLTDRGKKQFYHANSHNFYSDNLHQRARTQTLQIHFSHDLLAIFTVPLTSQERRVVITTLNKNTTQSEAAVSGEAHSKQLFC